MGLFNFIKDAGKKLLGQGNDDEAIKNEIESSFEGEPIQGLVVEVNDGTVTLAGVAQDNATREKAILIAGNVEGVEAVNADQLVTPEIIQASNERDLPEPKFYTIKKGDTLWAIAQEHYGDGNKYTYIVEQNLEVIKDPDLIYPGQTIRIPELA
jgi:nucleoid-associated protein YgaU